MDVSRNYIDLMYLTNPSNILKMKKLALNEQTINTDERKKYKKDIMKITECLIKGERISSDIDALFNEYVEKIKDHVKFTKKNNRIQSQFHLMEKKYVKMDISSVDISVLDKSSLDISVLDKSMMKKPKKKKKMIDFVKKKRKVKKIIIPKQISYD